MVKFQEYHVHMVETSEVTEIAWDEERMDSSQNVLKGSETKAPKITQHVTRS